jgi:hypothetical protein
MSNSMNRRRFLKNSGLLAASVTALQQLRPWPLQSSTRDGRRLRVLLFHDRAFPVIDTESYSRAALRRAFSSCELTITGASGFAAACGRKDFDLLVTAQGSAFPEDAGDALLSYLSGGGNWLHLGGVPMAVPVRRDARRWQEGARRTHWHRRLGITQAFPVSCGSRGMWTAALEHDALSDAAKEMQGERVFALYWRLTSSSYYVGEDGSAGPRDAVLRPLVNRLREDGTPVAAAVQCVDWLQGAYAGGRWVIATGDRLLSPKLLSALAVIAGGGAALLTAAPGFARYHWGETPTVIMRLRHPHGNGEASCVAEILHDGALLGSTKTTLRLNPRAGAEHAWLLDGEAVARLAEAAAVTPATGAGTAALFDIRVRCELAGTGGVHSIEARSGFWMAGNDAFAAGPRLGVSGTSMTLDGQPFTAAGTSYMAGDVQRNFLFEPNPQVWQQDFDEMRRAGITLLRSGIWFGWKRMMLEAGILDRSVLRAMDAIVLSAQRARLPLIFSFFAFLPESWGGKNPYLDPRAVDAQAAFVTVFARRYANAPGVVWDLINEPSFSSPSQLWRCRPNYDRFELDAWGAWLRRKYSAKEEAAHLRLLRDRWRGTGGEERSLPALEDFEDRKLFSDRLPLKVLDYRLFAQDAFADWVRTLSAAIREVDRKDRLIMVGQDEGGTLDRPSPQFFADAVDITSVHSWWFNDDLLWDTVVTRAPAKPHLVQESGAMFYETADGRPWRSEEESAKLVARKLAMAVSAGSAGFVQWLWNTNPYMNSDNEAAIGALRCDGSAKPEFDVLRAMARFLDTVGPSLQARQEEEVVLVIPHADQFSVRGSGVQAGRNCVRTMAYRCRVPLRGVSEYGLERDVPSARLYILPSPAVLTEAAWQQLLSRAHAGATLLVTGVLNRDDSWRHRPRSAVFGIASGPAPVAQSEVLTVGTQRYDCGFRGEDMQRIELATLPAGRGAVLLEADHGKGKLLWCPLPVELSDAEEAVAAVYREALRAAGVEPPCAVIPDLPGVLAYTSRFRDVTLVTVVSELAQRVDLRFRLQGGGEYSVDLPAGECAFLLLDDRGREIMRTPLPSRTPSH